MPTFQDLDSIRNFVCGGFIVLFVAIGTMGWRMRKLEKRIAVLEAQLATKP